MKLSVQLCAISVGIVDKTSRRRVRHDREQSGVKLASNRLACTKSPRVHGVGRGSDRARLVSSLAKPLQVLAAADTVLLDGACLRQGLRGPFGAFTGVER